MYAESSGVLAIAVRTGFKSTYGQPRAINPDSYKRDLTGKKGIIVFVVSGWSDATGHADLWDGSACVGSDYGDKASQIFFWEAF